MPFVSNFFVVGTDKRSINIKEMIEKEGSLANSLLEASVVIAPTPFSKDGETITGTEILISLFIDNIKNKTLFAGAINTKVREKLDSNNITYYDFMDYEEVAVLNAIPTAEGALQVAMENTDITLHSSKCLIIGYGRIGKVLSKMLRGIGANVWVCARKKEALANAFGMGYNILNIYDIEKDISSYDYIFNTADAMVMPRSLLEKVSKEVYIVDLASSPGGVDYEAANNLGIRANLALALPSKVAPKTSAKYFKDKIDEILANNK